MNKKLLVAMLAVAALAVVVLVGLAASGRTVNKGIAAAPAGVGTVKTSGKPLYIEFSTSS